MSVQTVTTGSFSTPGLIARDGHRTIVLATVSTSPNIFLQLPSGCLPDDIFEIYTDTASGDSSPAVLAPSGEDFGTNAPNPNVSVIQAAADKQGVIIRKLTSTRWVYVRGSV